MATPNNTALPNWVGVAQTLAGYFGTGAITVVSWLTSLAGLVGAGLNSDGQQAIGRGLAGARDAGARFVTWGVNSGRLMVIEGSLLYAIKYLVAPLTALWLTTWMSWDSKAEISNYMFWQMVIWLAVQLIQIFFLLRYLPFVAVAGALKGLAENPPKFTPNPLEALGIIRAFALTGARGSVELARDVALRVFADTIWFAVFHGLLLLFPPNVLPGWSIFVPAAACLTLIYVNNITPWTNRDYQGRTVLRLEEGGVIAVVGDDGKTEYVSVYKPEMPRVHEQWTRPLSVQLIFAYMAFDWLIYGILQTLNHWREWKASVVGKIDLSDSTWVWIGDLAHGFRGIIRNDLFALVLMIAVVGLLVRTVRQRRPRPVLARRPARR